MPTGTVKIGDYGDSVDTIHNLLVRKGITLSLEDEIKQHQFGPVTEAAIKQFQTENGLKVDGIVGPETLRALSVGNPTLNEFFSAPDYSAIRSDLARKVLELADGAYRIGVKEIPSGSNRGPHISDLVGGVDDYLTWHGSKAYLNYEKVDYSLGYPNNYKGAPWCAAFAAWMLKKACELTHTNSPLFGINDLMSDSKWLKVGRYANKVRDHVIPGAVGLIGDSPDNLRHVVLIATVVGDKIYTREGNSRGQKVAALVRSASEVQFTIDLSP